MFRVSRFVLRISGLRAGHLRSSVVPFLFVDKWWAQPTLRDCVHPSALGLIADNRLLMICLAPLAPWREKRLPSAEGLYLCSSAFICGSIPLRRSGDCRTRLPGHRLCCAGRNDIGVFPACGLLAWARGAGMMGRVDTVGKESLWRQSTRRNERLLKNSGSHEGTEPQRGASLCQLRIPSAFLRVLCG